MTEPSPRRLYMDNAATSFPKPASVLSAMMRYATELGASPGRGAYAEAVESAAILTDCRRRLNQLFNGQRPEHFIFTLNCSDALNLAIKGLIDPALSSSKGSIQHAICSHIDHNSILRPLHAMAERGWIAHTRVPVHPSTGLIDPDEIRRAIRPNTKLIAVTHASNVTGTVQPLREIGRMAREHDIPMVVDAAQSAGHVPIDVQADFIDLLAAPGHKGLLGPSGTGFLYVRPGIERILRPLKEGGTGSVSEQPVQPEFLPDKYEPGSHNAIGIAGLAEGVKWVAEQTVEKLYEHDRDLVRTFIDGASDVAGLRYHGPQGVRDRIGVFSVQIDGYDAHELAVILETTYGILTRPGIHCAPLAHAALGTADCGGTTRFSFGPFLSKQDVKYATDALASIATSLSRTRPRHVTLQ
ncbi:MAG TPA: aminotransferase class V-fold PLP-dependent enzyme [Tepidisphaeraceae bacterium]|nr:aminotransferase class V-fold PLP-dependent enzyme [Tepidisphaeraceae bacterium]